MKRLRSYITRLLVALLVCSGLSLYWIQPVQASHNSYAFAQWLSMMAESSQTTDFQQELEDLKRSGGDFEDFVEKASELVSNNDDFDFPFANEDTSREIHQLLLIEWKQFQTGNAMANMPVPHTVKSLMLLHIDKGAFGSFGNIQCETPQFGLKPISKANNTRVINVSIEPMSGGIAIGAP
ncbi:hypothetical protein LQ318_14760 [Aliifodinibius salicampi]|uniref:Fasciclin domain-containing protein n=1 Tax=Fodinibius salicampi TaxID=1920655 RepID=A0ABT3Q240_9BACT|nr:hypothetical protein [Fodinibius salicampi]MCW9714170.1 hypothetical protein [Fodinibius salicampi]